MQTKIMSIFTRTPLHVGAGSSVGAVDQPVIRERHTRFPVIPGSSLKGVLADLWREEGVDVETQEKKDKDGKVSGKEYLRIKDAQLLFGDNSNKEGAAAAGNLLIGEAKLLAFPVRSAKGCFVWLTCPLALSRFARDTGAKLVCPSPKNDEAVVMKDSVLIVSGKVIFEEYPLAVAAAPLGGDILAALQPLCGDKVWKELPQKLAVISDELFAYFAENACEIAQHNRINDTTGVVDNHALFNQENVPSETFFYCVMSTKDGTSLEKVEQKLKDQNGLLQIGADMTTGLGWCSVAMKEVK